MINAHDAVACARGFLGTPYAETDCIRLIVRVIRKCPGGDPSYRCEGTNWLWRSIANSSRYRHLTWRQEGIGGAKAGMLAFKKRGEDVHHVGLVTGEGTVIHASSVYGKVVETALDGSWHLLAQHRDIEPSPSPLATPLPTGEAGESAQEPGDAHASYDDSGARFTSLVREEDGAAILLAGRWRIAKD